MLEASRKNIFTVCIKSAKLQAECTAINREFWSPAKVSGFQNSEIAFHARSVTDHHDADPPLTRNRGGGAVVIATGFGPLVLWSFGHETAPPTGRPSHRLPVARHRGLAHVVVHVTRRSAWVAKKGLLEDRVRCPILRAQPRETFF